MEEIAGFCANCPWRNEASCPTPRHVVGGEAPLNVRLDIGREAFLACACYGAPADPHGPSRPPSLGSLPWGQAPYIQAEDRSIGDMGKARWATLQKLLKNPMDGLAAVGLDLLPERLQDILLAAVSKGRDVAVRVNLSKGAISQDRITLLALRALSVKTGFRLEVRDEGVLANAASFIPVDSLSTPPGCAAGSEATPAFPLLWNLTL